MHPHHSYQNWKRHNEQLQQEIIAQRTPYVAGAQKDTLEENPTGWLFMIEITRWRLRIGLTRQTIHTSVT